MGNNLFIFFDLEKPDQSHAIYSVIRDLGDWALIHDQLWYVNTEFSASDAMRKLREKLSEKDMLVVIDSANNNSAWFNLRLEVAEYLQAKGNFSGPIG